MEARRTPGRRSTTGRKETAAARGFGAGSQSRQAASRSSRRPPSIPQIRARSKGGQTGSRATAAAHAARGLMSQRSAGGSKKGPAAVAMAAAGALGGIVLARRRRAAGSDEPLERAGLPVDAQAPVGDAAPADPAGDATVTTLPAAAAADEGAGAGSPPIIAPEQAE